MGEIAVEHRPRTPEPLAPRADRAPEAADGLIAGLDLGIQRAVGARKVKPRCRAVVDQHADAFAQSLQTSEVAQDAKQDGQRGGPLQPVENFERAAARSPQHNRAEMITWKAVPARWRGSGIVPALVFAGSRNDRDARPLRGLRLRVIGRASALHIGKQVFALLRVPDVIALDAGGAERAQLEEVFDRQYARRQQHGLPKKQDLESFHQYASRAVLAIATKAKPARCARFPILRAPKCIIQPPPP